MSNIEDIISSSVHFCGLELDVYGISNTLSALGLLPKTAIQSNGNTTNIKAIDVLIFIHGREQSKKVIIKACKALAAAGNISESTGSLLVLAFDLPNHGERLTSSFRNYSWAQGNIDHGLDMWGCISLALGEIKTIISLFPTALAKPVRRWAVGGISLGGHITSLALAEDPRINMGIIAIGCGNLHKRLEGLAQHHQVPEQKMHDVLNQLAQKDATINIDRVIHAKHINGPLSNRWIMVLHGTADDVVTYESNKPFIHALQDRMHEYLDRVHEAEFNKNSVDPLRAVCNAAVVDTEPDASLQGHGHLRVNIYPEVGHTIPPVMLKAMGRWVSEWMCTPIASSSSSSQLPVSENDQRTFKL
ncbi:Alpha/Beta hydrolase protein [Syncephalis fuscata]|nr:Alpha/Beta hydrolase protein [Syncephalis fuscata]